MARRIRSRLQRTFTQQVERKRKRFVYVPPPEEEIAEQVQVANLLYDGNTALDIRIGVGASSTVESHANQLATDLNAFIDGADPFTVVRSNETSDRHIRVRVATGWNPGDPDWTVRSTDNGLIVEGRTEDWLARPIARLAFELGKRVWLPNPIWVYQPTDTTLTVDIDISKAYDVISSPGLGTSGGPWEKGTLETWFPEWLRTNMVDDLESIPTGHSWGTAALQLTPSEWTAGVEYTETGKRLQAYLQDESDAYYVIDRFAEWLADDMLNKGRTAVTVSTTDGIKGWEDVTGFGRDDGDPDTYNETEINLWVAKKVREYFLSRPEPEVQNATISMLAYGSTSYPPDGTKTDPDGDLIRIPEDLHIVVTKGFFQGTETWESVHASYDAIGDSTNHRSGYWYMAVWPGHRDQPGVAGVAQYTVVESWWNVDALQIEDGYPFQILGESSSGLLPHHFGSLLWRRAWTERPSSLAALASSMRSEWLSTLFPSTAVRSYIAQWFDEVVFMLPGNYAPLVSDDFFHRTYTMLRNALDVSPTSDEVARINRFAWYLRFLELHREVEQADVSTSAGLDVYDEFRAFCYTIRYEGLISYRLWTSRDVYGADEDLETRYGGNGLNYIQLENHPENVPSTWQPGGAYYPDLSDSGTSTIIDNGIANNPPFTFDEVVYPDNPYDGLVAPNPAAAAAAPVNRSSLLWYDRTDAVTVWYTTKTGQTTLTMWIRAWAIGGVGGAPGVTQTVRLFDEIGDPINEPVASIEIDENNGHDGLNKLWVLWEVTGLEAETTYRISIDDPQLEGVYLNWWTDNTAEPGDAAEVDISGTHQVTLHLAPIESNTIFGGSPQWFFYLPADAVEVGGLWYKDGASMRDANGDTVLTHSASNIWEQFDYDVVDEQDSVWRVLHGGYVALMTVPPYLAFHPDELVVPPSAVS